MEDTDRTIANALVKIFPSARKVFSKYPWIAQFVNFGIVGLSNTAIAYAAYAIVVSFNIHPQIANFISFCVSLLNAYVLNRYWTFKSTRSSNAITSVRFGVVYGGNYILGVVLLWVYFDVLHINKYLAPFLSLPLTVPLNFLINRLWVFI